MATVQASFQQPRHAAGIGVSLAVHVLLIGLWQLSRPVAVQDNNEAPRMQVLLPPPAAGRMESAPTEPARASPPSARAVPSRRQPLRTQHQDAAEPALEATASPAPQAAGAPPAPPLSSADLLREARAAAGAADRALRKENPRRGIQAPVETTAMKLARGITQAAEMAPNRWYQAPKTQEIIDPGGYGRRRHRVITASGTYCVTYESNHAPDGIDSMKEGIKPKLTTCDADEQPATRQEWH